MVYMDNQTQKEIDEIIKRRNLPPEVAFSLLRMANDLWVKMDEKFGDPKTIKEHFQRKHVVSNFVTRQKRRLICLIHYGGDPPKCDCCGERIIEFLTIDHNGIKPDKKFRSGDNLYGWLIKNNFPKGFRVLCLNCNHHIGHYGWCPHERENK